MLPKLEILSIYEGLLTEILPEIGQLRQLKNLNLCFNQISSLPPEIGHLKNLTVLSVNSNPITELPPEIGDLTALQEINISQYPMLIKELPLTMENCTHITKIEGLEWMGPVPLSLAVSWPEYEDPSNLTIQLPSEMEHHPVLSLQDLLDGKSVTVLAFGRMTRHFTPSMKTHLLNTLPSDHPYIMWLKTKDALYLPSGYSIQR
ncbi:MAG: leucine-rich repeat domain-containing protein [Promethearchaeota archaeon]